MNRCINKKMKNPTAPVRRGAATHEMNIFFVSFQFTDSIPFAATLKPIMHPMTYANKKEGVFFRICEQR